MSLQESNQKNMISLAMAIATVVGCVIGASIFVMLGPITAKTGPSLYLAYIIAMIQAAFGSVAYAQLGAAMPSTGGSYYYASRLLSPITGFNQAMFMIIAAIGVSGMLAVGFAQYLHFYLPSMDVTAVAVGVLILFYIINLFGLRLAGSLQILMCIWLLLALLLFAIPGLLHVKAHEGPFLVHGVGGLMFAAALAFFSYTGFGVISELGGEVKNPKRNIPLSIIISFLITTLVYVLVTYVSTGVISWQELAKSEASLPAAAAVFLPGWAAAFIGLGALFAVATTLNAIMMVAPREFMALCSDNLLPEIINKKNRSGAPYISLTIITVISLFFVVIGLKIDYMATLAVAGLLLLSALTALAAWRLPKKLPQVYENASFKIKPFWLALVSWLGFLSMIFFFLLAIVDYPSVAVIYIILVVASSAYFSIWVKRMTLEEKNIFTHRIMGS
ncbi:MAG: APC family permease [Desulfocucumaceae bacterium]